jgi:molybdopterin converting factor small subunit
MTVPMLVRVRVPTQLRDVAGGTRAVDVEVATAPATVADVLDALARLRPALERRVRDEQGRVRQHVNVFVGADNIRDRDGTATPLRPGEELSIVPAVSGG